MTAKAGSQSIAAGLIGTTLGIGLSSSIVFLTSDITKVSHYYLMGFGVLAMIHQGCTYQSLQQVPIPHLNRHRLDVVLHHYLEANRVLSPADVAPSDLPSLFLNFQDVNGAKDWTDSTSSQPWLSIGSPLEDTFHDSNDMEEVLIDATNARYFSGGGQGQDDSEQYRYPWKSYVLRFSKRPSDNSADGSMIHLIFWDDATGEDVICGVMHAFLVRQYQQNTVSSDDDLNEDSPILKTEETLRERLPKFMELLQSRGWKTGTEFTTVEANHACRLRVTSN